MSKHFAHWEECARKARARNKRRKDKGLSPEPWAEPFLWIIAATVLAPLLRHLGAKPAPSFPPGVYVIGDELLRVRIVVASELLRDRSTLLVRLMAAGPGLAAAVADLGALPDGAPERAAADGIVIHLQSVLGKKPNPTPKEEEFIVIVNSTWAQARQLGRDEGRLEGRMEGRMEEAARNLLTVLRVRGVAVPDAARERVLAQKDTARLEQWLEKAAVATSMDEVLGEPS